MKKMFNKEKFLYLFILISPILDICSSIFNFGKYSISLFIRPIIPLIVLIYIFIRDKHVRKYLLFSGIVYLGYSVIHLYLFSGLVTSFSYGNVIYEASYLANYSFLIFTLLAFIYVFRNGNTEKLKLCFLIYISFYIISIYLAIITKTSFYTYLEGFGYRGWFNTGGAVSSILICSLFILFPYLFENKKHLIFKIILLSLIIIYLVLLVGTRTGLFGAVIALVCYFVFQIFIYIFKNKKLNKKMIIIFLSSFVVLALILVLVGSNTIERRKHLDGLNGEIPVGVIDSNNETIYMAYDLVKLKRQIDNNEISNDFMLVEQKNAIIRLDAYSKSKKLPSTDLRRQQLIYHHYLYHEQKNFLLKLFGNGYLTNMGMLTLEMEIIASFYNFGIIGLILFFGPFFAIFLYGTYTAFKSFSKLNLEYLMLLAGCFMSYIISILAGHTYFNSSVMIVIILLHTLLFIKSVNMKGED